MTCSVFETVPEDLKPRGAIYLKAHTEKTNCEHLPKKNIFSTIKISDTQVTESDANVERDILPIGYLSCFVV